MATHGRGLICLAMTPEGWEQLNLTPMERDNTALGGTAFTVSISSCDSGYYDGHLGLRSGGDHQGRP